MWSYDGVFPSNLDVDVTTVVRLILLPKLVASRRVESDHRVILESLLQKSLPGRYSHELMLLTAAVLTSVASTVRLWSPWLKFLKIQISNCENPFPFAGFK